MGHVGIIAGVLDHPGRRRAVSKRGGSEREGGVAAPGQGHLDGVGKRAGQQRRIRGLGGRRSAGAGGPAAAEHLGFRCHAHRYKAPNGPRHGGTLLP